MWENIRRTGATTAVSVILLMAFLLTVANAQQGGLNGGVVPPTKAPTRTGPSTAPPGPQPTIYYTGKVLLDTGMAPPEPAAVLRVCNGASRRQTMTSVDGSFSFMTGDRNNDLLPDASDDTRGFGPDVQMGRSNSTGTGQRNLDSRFYDCELRADLAGYSSSSIRLDPSMNNSNVGVIVLHYRGKKAEGMISVASLAVPGKARKEYEKGSEALEKGNSGRRRKVVAEGD